MQPLTSLAIGLFKIFSRRYGVSQDAVKTLLFAVNAGGGTMAQFYHPDLGGGGQWMRGGMTMVGDMFNGGLQVTVAGLCSELSSLLASQQVLAPLPVASGGGFMASGNSWWPSELGSPSSSGGQNDARHAYFPQARRLAILSNGKTFVYDTLDHQIGGVQQQQGGPYGSLSFSSQFGTFTVDSLPLVSPAPAAPAFSPQPAPSYQASPAPISNQSAPNSQSQSDVFTSLERLGQLHQSGILSDDEFRTKKAELLARL